MAAHAEEPATAGAGRFPGRAPIDAYGNGGFRFADMSHRGAILCLPAAIEAWAPATVDELTPLHFERILDERSAIRQLILGTGPAFALAPRDVRSLIEGAGITLETMDTGAACRTYNILLGEGRLVAAALLPVA